MIGIPARLRSHYVCDAALAGRGHFLSHSGPCNMHGNTAPSRRDRPSRTRAAARSAAGTTPRTQKPDRAADAAVARLATA
jgi:hypothetical protein